MAWLSFQTPTKDTNKKQQHCDQFQSLQSTGRQFRSELSKQLEFMTRNVCNSLMGSDMIMPPTPPLLIKHTLSKWKCSCLYILCVCPYVIKHKYMLLVTAVQYIFFVKLSSYIINYNLSYLYLKTIPYMIKKILIANLNFLHKNT